jgi:uncharacterized delta-60 repeat protein
MPMRTRLRQTLCRMTVAAVVSLVLASGAAAAQPAPGRLDPRFGDGGIVTRDFGTEATPGRALAAMPGPDGTTLVLQPGRVGVAVARYLPDGRLDRSFGDDGVGLDPKVNSFDEGKIAAGPGGTILALTGGAISRFTAGGELDRRYGEGGHVRYSRSVEYPGVTTAVASPNGAVVVVEPDPNRRAGRVVTIRYGPTGRRDRTYGHDASEAAAFPSTYQETLTALGLSDGGLLLSSPGEGEGGQSVKLLRLDPKGRIDRSFGKEGRVVLGPVHGIPVGLVEEANGSVVVATEGNDLARVSAGGQPDPSFGKDGVAHGPVPRMKLQALLPGPSGGLMGVGYALTGKGGYSPADFAAERFGADGRPDASFGGGTGYVTTSRDPTLLNEALGAAVLPDGRIVLAGGSGPSDGNFVFQVTLAALEPDGAPAADFGEAGFVTTKAVSASRDAVTDLSVERHGGLVAAGHAHGAVAVARFSAAGRLDRSFGDDGTHLFPSTDEWEIREGAALAAAPGGTLIVGPGSSGPPGIFRLGPGGNLDRGFGHEGQAGADVFGQAVAVGVEPGGKILAGGLSAGYDRLVARFDGGGGLDRSFSRSGKRVVSKAGEAGYEMPLAQGPGGIVGVLTGLGAPAVLSVRGKPIVPTDARLASARTETRLPGEIVDMAFSGPDLLVLGGRARGLAVTRLLPDGRPDPAFGRDGLRTLKLGGRFLPGRLAVEPDGRILASGVSFEGRFAGQAFAGRATVVRLDPDGSLDPSFGHGGIFRARRATTVRITALALGAGTVTAGGAAVVPGSRDLQMQLLRLRR